MSIFPTMGTLIDRGDWTYNRVMARGWESKSVEEQQSEAKSEKERPKIRLTPNELAKRRKKDGLLLSRNRVLQQMQSANSPAHRQMLELALADLDSQITRLG